MGALSDYFLADHKRLAALLDRAADGEVNEKVYGELRAGLFAHIAMEERCVLPAIVEAKGGRPLLTARRVRAEHRAIRALLVLPSTRGTIGLLRRVLIQHETLEDGPGGLYESCEAFLGPRADEVLSRCRAFRPEPALAPAASENAFDDAIRALSAAGFQASETELQ